MSVLIAATRRPRGVASAGHLGWLLVLAEFSLAAPRSRAQTDPAPGAAAGKNAAVQIEVEAKFVGLSVPDLATRMMTSGKRDGNRAISQTAIDALLFGAAGTAASGTGSVSLTGVFTDPQFQTVLRALNQKKGVDLLSAPRVTTRSGQRAVIEIIREFRYPNTFAEPKEGEPVTPASFETRNTGVTLEVLPTLAADGRIQLDLVPQVVEFLGFVNYGVRRPAWNSGKGDALAALLKPTSSKHVINQPIFGTRKVTTTAVLRSGETILIGGLGAADDPMANADRSGRDGRPKPPAGNTERSLFIFVTARALPGDGKPAVPSAPDRAEQLPESTKQGAAREVPGVP